jgi:hypothetical protein
MKKIENRRFSLIIILLLGNIVLSTAFIENNEFAKDKMNQNKEIPRHICNHD